MDLSGNDIEQLPRRLGALPHLQSLHVAACPLKELNANVCRISSLTELDVSHCELSSLPMELGNLRCLRRLSVHHNSITSLPPSIGRLSRLAELYLNDNRLVALPIEVSHLSALSYLTTGCNPLLVPPPSICRQGAAAVRHFLYMAGRSLDEDNDDAMSVPSSASDTCSECLQNKRDAATAHDRAAKAEKAAEKHKEAAIRKDRQVDTLRKENKSAHTELTRAKKQAEAAADGQVKAQREVERLKQAQTSAAQRARDAESREQDARSYKEWLSCRAEHAEAECERLRTRVYGSERENTVLRGTIESLRNQMAHFSQYQEGLEKHNASCKPHDTSEAATDGMNASRATAASHENIDNDPYVSNPTKEQHGIKEEDCSDAAAEADQHSEHILSDIALPMHLLHTVVENVMQQLVDEAAVEVTDINTTAYHIEGEVQEIVHRGRKEGIYCESSHGSTRYMMESSMAHSQSRDASAPQIRHTEDATEGYTKEDVATQDDQQDNCNVQEGECTADTGGKLARVSLTGIPFAADWQLDGVARGPSQKAS